MSYAVVYFVVYSHAISAPCYAYYGEGSGVIWLSKLVCTDTANSLSRCHHAGWGVVDTDYWDPCDDAGASCTCKYKHDAGITLELTFTGRGCTFNVYGVCKFCKKFCKKYLGISNKYTNCP